MGTDKTAMSNGSKSKKPTTEKKTWGTTFIECELNEQHKEALKKWDVKGTEAFDGLDRLINDGYKISFAQDVYHDCVAAFATSPANDGGVREYTLSARGPGLLQALRALCYKHFIMLDQRWVDPERPNKDRDVWG